MPSGQDAADARRPLDRPPTPGGLAQVGRTSGGEPQAATDEGSARSWIRRHAVGIAFALFLAAALVFPRWWLLTTSPPEGHRIQVSVSGARAIGLDEALYGALIRDAYDGRLPIRDPFLNEEDDAAPQTGTFWDIAVGLAGHPLGGIAQSLAVFSTIAAVAALVLLYTLAWRLTRSSWLAMACLGNVLAATYVLRHSPGFFALRHREIWEPLLRLDPQGELHLWTRFLAPSMPLPFLLGAILLLPGAVLDGGRARMAGAAALFAVLVYSYLFFWVSVGLALGAWAVWLWWSGERGAAGRAVLIVLGGMLLALPEVAVIGNNYLTASSEAQSRVGAFGEVDLWGAWVRPVLQRLVVGAPFAWFALKDSRRNALYVALFVAPLGPAATSDWLPQTDHFLFQAWPVLSIPLFITGGMAAARRLPVGGRRTIAMGFCALGVLSTAFFVTMQVRGYREVDGTYAMPEDEYAAFQWMNRNLSPEDTVATPSWITNQLVAALTPSSTYLADGFLTRVSTDEQAERYLRVSAAYGVDEGTTFYRIDPVRDVPTSKKDVPRTELERYYDEAMVYYLFNEGIRRPKDLMARVPRWQAAYRQFLTQAGVLQSRDADYLFCGHRERFWKTGDTAPGTWVVPAFEQGDAAVYRLVAEGAPGAREFAGCGEGTSVKQGERNPSVTHDRVLAASLRALVTQP